MFPKRVCFLPLLMPTHCRTSLGEPNTVKYVCRAILDNEPFSTAERSERVENFLFRAMREQTGAGIHQATVSMRLHGANRPELRRCAAPGTSDTPALRLDQTRQRCAQQTSNYITALLWPPRPIVGPLLLKRIELCAVQLAHPPPILGAWSLNLHVTFACFFFFLHLCESNTQLHNFLVYNHVHSRAPDFLDSLFTKHIMRRHMHSWRRLLRGYDTRFFLRSGSFVRARSLFPSIISWVRGSVSSHLWVLK